MVRRTWALALAGAGLLASASVVHAAYEAAPPPLIAESGWARAPDDLEVERLYPHEAWRAQVGGKVILECRVTRRGRTTACEIWDESPSGWGFGKAALDLAPLYEAGPDVASGAVRMPIRFVPRDPAAPVSHGRVTVRCLARADGGVEACAVLEELPRDAGYGLQALREAASYRPQTPTAAGAPVETTFTFKGPPSDGAETVVETPRRRRRGPSVFGVLFIAAVVFGAIALRRRR